MSLKNLSVAIKIPKLLESKLNNKKIAQIYRRFDKSYKFFCYLTYFLKV